MKSSEDTLHPTHLTDDQLLEAYVLLGDNEHLRTCRDCGRRYEGLVHALEQVRDDALTQADAIFTADRLHDQRERILRRLERHEHPADVLLFPNRTGQDVTTRHLLAPARRWVAGAAAAGLVAGLFLGFAVDRRVGSLATSSPGGVARGGVAQGVAAERSLSHDEQILDEIEEAVTGPGKVLELGAIDVMPTPAELQEASFDPR